MLTPITIPSLITTRPRRMNGDWDFLDLTPATAETFVGPPDYTETATDYSTAEWNTPTTSNWWDSALSTLAGGASQAAVDAARKAAGLPAIRRTTTPLSATVAKASTWIVPVGLAVAAYFLLRKK